MINNLISIKTFQDLHNAAKGDPRQPPYPVQDRFSIEKTRTLKAAVIETRLSDNGTPHNYQVEPAVTKRVFDTNGFTKLAIAYLKYQGFEAKRISSEGKYRPGVGFIPSENKGISDIMAIRDGRVYFIEVKQPKENQLESQQKFEEWATKGGAPYAIVRGWEDLQQKVLTILNNIQ
jgi:hypothetical protein